MNIRLPKNVKYVHFLFGHDSKFSTHILKLFWDPENQFKSGDHIFITPYEEVYEILKNYPNVFLDKSKRNFYMKYHNKCDFMISHRGQNQLYSLFTPRNIKKKIIFRYWGGSITTSYKLDYKHPIASIYKFIKIMLFKHTYLGFAGIGVSCFVDIIDLSRILGNRQKYYTLSYLTNESYEIANEIKLHQNYQKTNNKIRILLGHRGTPENNHVDILNRLMKYDSKKFTVYIPLSYGDKEYIQKIKLYIKKKNYNNVIIIEEFMPFDDYTYFLSTIDIGIFDGITSYALGNIQELLFFRKTLYLNTNGVIAKAFDIEGGYYRDISKIGLIPFEKFSEQMNYPKDFTSNIELISPERSINEWKKMFAELDELISV